MGGYDAKKSEESDEVLKEKLIKALRDDNLEEFKGIAKKMEDPNPKIGRGYLIEELAWDYTLNYVEALIETGKVKLDVPTIRFPNISLRECVSQRYKDLKLELPECLSQRYKDLDLELPEYQLPNKESEGGSQTEGALTEKKTKSKNNWKNFSIKSLINKFGLKPLRNNHRGRKKRSMNMNINKDKS